MPKTNARTGRYLVQSHLTLLIRVEIHTCFSTTAVRTGSHATAATMCNPEYFMGHTSRRASRHLMLPGGSFECTRDDRLRKSSSRGEVCPFHIGSLKAGHPTEQVCLLSGPQRILSNAVALSKKLARVATLKPLE